jgi:eukaryotic-like serine/threonine-protein kinase
MALRLTPEQMSRLGRLLDEVLELEAGRRAAWFDTLRGEDAELRPVVEQLLSQAASLEAADFLGALPKLTLTGLVGDSARTPAYSPRDAVGPYWLERELGRGGMATVWLAERLDRTLKRKVALKLPHQGTAREQLAQRLERERDILSSLEHPNIARLYDAGVAENGQPFLALEYVEGHPIDRYAHEHILDLRQRLGLFLQVARAVAYAHARLVLHRDLKPSNILVTLNGQVRLLDFGIAKLLAEGAAHETELTQVGGRALTPDYASPEQIAGQPLTTASDTYSLGVVLYELLCERRPYKLTRSSMGALEEAILAAEPVRPSRAAPPGFARGLVGDLDTIVLKMLEKAPGARYATVNAAIDDIERHLAGQPVLARPGSAWYRARKLVRRHRLGVSIAAGLALLLIAFYMSMALQARRVAREAAAAEAVSTFLTHVFSVSDPNEARGNVVTARELLDKAATDVDRTMADQPELRGRLLIAMTRAYDGLGLYKTAESLNRRALQSLLTASGGKPTAASVQAQSGSAFELWRLGDFQEAEKMARQAVQDGERVVDKDNPALLAAKRVLAITEESQEHYEAAVKLFEQVYDSRRRALGPENDETLKAQLEFGQELIMAGRDAEAAPLLRSLLAVLDRTRPPENRTRLHALDALTELVGREGKADEAIALFRSTLELHRRVLGPEHPHTLGVMHNFIPTLISLKRYPEADSLARQTLAARERVLGPDHPWTTETRIFLGQALVHEGRFAEAESVLQQAAPLAKKIGPKSSELQTALLYLAEADEGAGQRDEAYVHLEQAVAAGATQNTLRTESLLDALRNEPQFKAIFERASAKPAP